MRIYEITGEPESSAEQEDDAQGKFDANKVDQNLQDVANDVNYQQAQPDPQTQQPQPTPELDDKNAKPIDAALMSEIKALPYTKKYDFDDDSPLNPMTLAAMSVEDLKYTQAKVRYKMQLLTMKDQVGMDDDRTMEFCNDLMRMLNTIMHFKTTNTKNQLAATNPSPSYQSMT